MYHPAIFERALDSTEGVSVHGCVMDESSKLFGFLSIIVISCSVDAVSVASVVP